MNPEFRRQLWLGFSSTRLVLMPALLLACFAAAYLTDKDNAARALTITGAAIFAVLVWGMGALAAGTSVMEEVTDRTWDQQRMSAMQPWAMTWGKLGGASAYGWYGGALCLLVALPAAVVGGHGDQLVQLTLSAILIGVFLQALLLALNLQLVKAGGPQTRRGGVWVLLVLLWSVVPLMGMRRELTVIWWGQSFNHLDFALTSVALFTLCALVAAWRSMAEILAVRQLPWAWPALALLSTLYFSGFASAYRLATFTLVGLVICAFLTFFALLTEPQPRPLWQRVVTRLLAGQWRAALLQLPRWPTTLLLGVVFAVLVSVSMSQPVVLPWSAAEQIMLQPITFVLLMVRDCALALFFAFAVKNKRAVATFLVLIMVLYGVLPWLLGALGSHTLSGLVLPLQLKSKLSLLIAVVHAVLAMCLLGWRWRATRP
jgi:hypothetical protein